jgi:hypothetical protein
VASISKRVAAALQKEFIDGTVFRVDLDHVDVAPAGSTGILRSLPLTGDRDKIKAGDAVRVINVAGQRVALAGDVALDATANEEIADASGIELDERFANIYIPAQESSGGSESGNGETWIWCGPLSNTQLWSGQAHATTAKTLINLSQDFGLPTGVKEVKLYVAVKDSMSATSDSWVCFWNNTVSNAGVFVDCTGNAVDKYDRNEITVPCDADGNIYYQILTGGSQSLWILVLAYKFANTPTNAINHGWVDLAAPLINSNWYGQVYYSTVSTITSINAYSAFGVPSGAKALKVSVFAVDSGSKASVSNCRFVVTPIGSGNDEQIVVYLDGVNNSGGQMQTGVIPLDSSGNFGYKIQATGTNTMRCWIEVWGYLLGDDVGVASGWVFQDGYRANTFYNKLSSAVAAKTVVNLRNEFNLPVGTTAVLMRLALQDTASGTNPNLSFAFYRTSTSLDAVMVVRMQGAPNSAYVEEYGVVPLDEDGNVYYTTGASGTNTLTIYMVCCGYMLPASIERSNAQTLQGYQPRNSSPDAHVMLTDGYGNTPNLDWRVVGGASYSTASQVVIPTANYTAYFPKGAKVRIKQTSYKYFYVTSTSYTSSNTYVNLTGGSNYSVANAAIEELAFSHVQLPEGFPEWFDYTPTWTAATTAPAIGNGSLVGRFKMDGSLCTLLLRMTASTTTTFGSGNWTFSIPVPVDSSLSYPYFGLARVRRPGQFNYLLTAQLANIDTVLQFFMPTNQGGTNVNNLSSTIPMTWTASASDYLEVQIQYKF